MAAQEDEAARAFVACPLGTAKSIAAQVVGDEEEVSADEANATFVELVNQAFSALSDATKTRLSRKIEMAPAEPFETAPPDPALALEFQFELAGGAFAFAFCAESAWIRTLEPPPTEPQPREQAEEQLVSAPSNLGRLLEVDLDLAISFGETRLPLSEVMKLSSGSIVELNRTVSDTVDLLVNNSIIARGEVVVVDGNYGVRVTEVSSAEKRMETLL